MRKEIQCALEYNAPLNSTRNVKALLQIQRAHSIQGNTVSNSHRVCPYQLVLKFDWFLVVWAEVVKMAEHFDICSME